MSTTNRLAKAREYKLKHADQIRDWQNRYNAAIRKDPERNAAKNAANSKSAKKNHEKRMAYDKNRDKQKISARAIVRSRIYRGTLVRQPCEKCGMPNAHAHHDDYSKPLEIRWLCPLHHKEIHHGK